jgi:hypothetical protein
MNPDDIAAIKPYLAASETLSSIIISADTDLARGDIELSTDNLRYADRVIPKPVPGAMARRSAEVTADEITETPSGASE